LEGGPETGRNREGTDKTMFEQSKRRKCQEKTLQMEGIKAMVVAPEMD